jgi:FkbM family methyltransferase
MLTAPELEGAATRYVWEVEASCPTTGKVTANVGDLEIGLDLQYLHERRYALGLLFGFRNPQADIDRQLFRTNLRPDDVVLDVGANIGVTAAEALACGARHVLCVEPERSLVRRLNILKAICPDRMSVWHCALGAYEGIAELHLSQGHNQGHTVSRDMMALFPSLFGSEHQQVQVSTIDGLLACRPSSIWKIDAEGAEADVIRGARLTLQRSPPRAIFVELYDTFVNEVVELLPGYELRRAALTKADYTLRLLDQVGGTLPDEFCPTSPTYVFARAE